MKFCECIKWARTEQPFTDKHHKNCPKYNDKIRVIKVTHMGNTFVDTNMETLGNMEEWDYGTYLVEITEMYQRDLDAMPEFQGF
jgi:hypothetical protein